MTRHSICLHAVFAMADSAAYTRAPALVIATYRPGEAGRKVARAIERLERNTCAQPWNWPVSMKSKARS
jgi:hypothetical protein